MPAACIERGFYLNGRVLERAAAVIVHSPWCVEQVRSRFPHHVDKMSVVPPGATALDPSPEERRAIRARLGMPPDALVIASLGRIHPTKMNAETIAAFAPLAREIPGALLVFAGKEDDQGEARRTATELGLGHRVRFLGHHPADVAADLAAIADIGVCLRRPPTGGETSAALIGPPPPGRADDRLGRGPVLLLPRLGGPQASHGDRRAGRADPGGARARRGPAAARGPGPRGVALRPAEPHVVGRGRLVRGDHRAGRRGTDPAPGRRDHGDAGPAVCHLAGTAPGRIVRRAGRRAGSPGRPVHRTYPLPQLAR